VLGFILSLSEAAEAFNQVIVKEELQVSFEKLLNEWQDYQNKAETINKSNNYL